LFGVALLVFDPADEACQGFRCGAGVLADSERLGIGGEPEAQRDGQLCFDFEHRAACMAEKLPPLAV
jgi:hypothetical protein